MNRSNKTSSKQGTSIVTITRRDGSTFKLDVNSIRRSQWQRHSGTADDGTQVHSMETYQPDNSSSILLRNSNDPTTIIVSDNATLEVFAKSFLRGNTTNSTGKSGGTK